MELPYGEGCGDEQDSFALCYRVAFVTGPFSVVMLRSIETVVLSLEGSGKRIDLVRIDQ